MDCHLKAYGAGSGYCEKHGTKFMDWKCTYCCSVATFKCSGNIYLCDDCYEAGSLCWKLVIRECSGVNCPLGVPHPPVSLNKRESTFPIWC